MRNTLLLAFQSAIASAQEFRGTILGVTDPSGAGGSRAMQGPARIAF